MLAAFELRRAGYPVRILEYQNRAGGRNCTLHGGDSVTELGGITQKIGCASGNCLNPRLWRIPYHHQALLHYCRAFGAALEPFIQVNHNAYVHGTGMPWFADKLSDAQVASVVNYVRSHFGNGFADAVSAADVAPQRPQAEATREDIQ